VLLEFELRPSRQASYRGNPLKRKGMGVVVHFCNPGYSKNFKASLGYIRRPCF
jgi:hypothetical protein